MNIKNVGDLLSVDKDGILKQNNQMILDLNQNLAIRNQQVSQLATAYSELNVEYERVKDWLRINNPDEFKKLYESEVKNDGTTENANADVGLAEDDNI